MVGPIVSSHTIELLSPLFAMPQIHPPMAKFLYTDHILVSYGNWNYNWSKLIHHLHLVLFAALQQHPVVVNKNTVSNSKFEALQKTEFRVCLGTLTCAQVHYLHC